MKTRKIGFYIGALLLLPIIALAANEPPLSNLGPNDVVRILNNLLGFLYAIFLVTAAICIIFAAYRYTFSGGNEEQIKTANKALVYAAVGIAAAMVSTGIIKLVESLLTS